MTTATKITLNSLTAFSGEGDFYRYSSLFRRHLLTGGTKYLAEVCGAYWLMDAIASHLPNAVRRDRRLREFQIWKLRKNKTNDGVSLTCWADTGPSERAQITQRIEFSDFFDSFDGTEITLYAAASDGNWVIMLPSEY